MAVTPEYEALLNKLGLTNFSDLVDHLYVKCEDLVESCKLMGSTQMSYDCCKGAKVRTFPSGKCYAPVLEPQAAMSSGVQILLKVIRGKKKTKSQFSFAIVISTWNPNHLKFASQPNRVRLQSSRLCVQRIRCL